MSSVFHAGRADFSGISPPPSLTIKNVVHKTRLDIHEEGAEGSAATAVNVFYGQVLDPSTPLVFKIAHPLLLCIRHRAAGALLFLRRWTGS